MPTSQLFADLLQGYSSGKKTGALYVAVAEASENLIRFYFNEGRIYSMSYGPIQGRECLDIPDCYNLGKDVYFDGLKTPAVSTDLPCAISSTVKTQTTGPSDRRCRRDQLTRI